MPTPGLHITLGVFQRIFNLMENECHQLDLQLSGSCSSTSTTFLKYIEAREEITKLDEEKTFCTNVLKQAQQQLVLHLLTTPDPQNDTRVKLVAELLKEKQDRITVIEREINQQSTIASNGFDKDEGIFVQSLDKSLKSFNVERQAYHGGSFIGNHVHRTLKHDIVDIARENDESLVQKVQEVSETFSKAFSLFSECHSLYDQSYMSSDDIEKLETAIDEFCQFYRASFTNSTFLPKMHMLEDHVIPWVKKWKAACGLMGEQGAESLHAQFNSTERAYNSMRDCVQRLKVVLSNHHLQILPATTSLEPPLLKIKKKKID